MDAFHTSPTLGVETIASLIPIYLHFQKTVENTKLELLLYLQIILSILFLETDILRTHLLIISLEKT